MLCANLRTSGLLSFRCARVYILLVAVPGMFLCCEAKVQCFSLNRGSADIFLSVSVIVLIEGSAIFGYVFFQSVRNGLDISPPPGKTPWHVSMIFSISFCLSAR